MKAVRDLILSSATMYAVTMLAFAGLIIGVVYGIHAIVGVL